MRLKFYLYDIKDNFPSKNVNSVLDVVLPITKDYYPLERPTLFRLNDGNLVGIKYAKQDGLEEVAFIIKTDEIPEYKDNIINLLNVSDNNRKYVEIAYPFEDSIDEKILAIYKKFHKP
jgi:hypothetical protein